MVSAVSLVTQGPSRYVFLSSLICSHSFTQQPRPKIVREWQAALRTDQAARLSPLQWLMSTHPPRFQIDLLFWKLPYPHWIKLRVAPTCHGLLGSPRCSTCHTVVIIEFAGFHSSVSPTGLISLGHRLCHLQPCVPRNYHGAGSEQVPSKCQVGHTGPARRAPCAPTSPILTTALGTLRPWRPLVPEEWQSVRSRCGCIKPPPCECCSAASGWVSLWKSLQPEHRPHLLDEDAS